MSNLIHMRKMLKVDAPEDDGRRPIYYYSLDRESMERCYKIMYEVSTMLWTYFNYTGYTTPWHNKDSRKEFNVYQKSFLSVIKFITDVDIDLKSYCILLGVLHDYDKYVRPSSLFGINKSLVAMLKRFRQYAGSRDSVRAVRDFLVRFMELQIEHMGHAFIARRNIISRVHDSNRTKNFGTYNSIFDRIKDLGEKEIDPILWLELKFKNCIDFKPDDIVLLRTISNTNGLDPKLDELKELTNDPWREIRMFLSLSSKCEFPDGYIPKGWYPSNGDFSKSEDIVRVRGDGFYYYPTGEQRRGKRHYASNTYLGIKCNPDNFLMFKDRWRDKRMLMAKPTWEEYSKYAIHNDMWDEDGNSTNGRMKSVKWRKR